MKFNPRLNRLRNDYVRLQELAARSPFVTIEHTEGYPPEKYILHLTCKGIREVDKRGKPIYAQSHRLMIYLDDQYPRKLPLLKILTRIFHPDILLSGDVPIGNYSPGIGLDDVVIGIIQLIRYEGISSRSPCFFSNVLAVNWANKNQHLFPLDTRPILGEIMENSFPIHEDEIEDEIEIVIF